MTTNKNKAAQALGRLGAGKPKSYTAEELERREKILNEARAKRWPKKTGGNIMKVVVEFSEKGRMNVIDGIINNVHEKYKPSMNLNAWIEDAFRRVSDRGEHYKPDYEIESMYARDGQVHLIPFSDDDFIWEEIEE